MFSFLKPDPVKKLEKQLDLILEQAMNAQRKGDIRQYSQLTLDADNLDKQIQKLKQNKNQQ
ncbi:Lacal_2735 family protein [Shewanella maritima]|uniref:Lacal_2735 family protein n=1 Tax=Shewanella maritima TaxID=2520507 RepID=A0A411PMA0_9GAMM|nr:DUF6435 family protein [Shewanella maritima]QBF84643.1 Lacal_2735 family protein [Shewanella maritima]